MVHSSHSQQFYKAKEEFAKNKGLSDEEAIIAAVARGRWYLNNEIIPIIQLKKYRSLKQSYYDDNGR